MPSSSISLLLLFFSLSSSFLFISAARNPSFLFHYHNGPLLSGNISINLIWYGNFNPSQKAIVTDFLSSLSSSSSSKPITPNHPSVSTWWNSIHHYYYTKPLSLTLSLASQILDPNYSLGKSLTNSHILTLASSTGGHTNSINLVLTAADVTVPGFCFNKCGSHGSALGAPYIWVGNSQTQCPAYCAWPFHQPFYAPHTPPLLPPNNDVGMDGLLVNLATLLAGTATNPFGNGFYQGPKEAPLEAASACTGIFAKGSYPGFPGQLLLDSVTGGSYNANGQNGRKYLLPALFDPKTSACSTLL